MKGWVRTVWSGSEAVIMYKPGEKPSPEMFQKIGLPLTPEYRKTC